ncbi:hypothetical protein BVRB_8g194490 [Beta vulgaris subsp. vulgaris]|nr:hypothetical protein BVRB_8g194490 [Beta vulgaris subsp. vulgaris]
MMQTHETASIFIYWIIYYLDDEAYQLQLVYYSLIYNILHYNPPDLVRSEQCSTRILQNRDYSQTSWPSA